MNKQQRSLLIALIVMLVAVIVVILVISLGGRDGEDQTINMDVPALPIATVAAPVEGGSVGPAAATAVPETTAPPLSEEEMARQAMEEEMGDPYAETAPPYEAPID